MNNKKVGYNFDFWNKTAIVGAYSFDVWSLIDET